MDLLKRLGLNKYNVDKKSHIKVNLEICRTCKEKPCIKVCPAGTYERSGDVIEVHYERCLECGAALVACPFNAIEFQFPEGGISYRYG
ncbi:MAG: 4Fe-4S dicluster domain-containing protein [Metallosphaera yellowstonensis]|uniref:Ferredoxin-like protein n=1 Tax=Metallosphaera yellowstonensis MK1 TaxID=671065 RepID=H2C5M5_9CREN|nr:4Fe-4S dicluster domain-containing protein [Metallosphaera yellowstonensis]EHP69102.1 ferredoxin-like protein [Metallosphaera yellowstonensis MK1]